MNWRVFLIIFLLPALALAQSAPIKANPPGEDKIEPIKKGDPAPFSGQLFEPATALRWGNWLQQYQLRLRLDVETEQAICKAQTDYLKDVRAIEKSRNAAVEKDLLTRLKRAEEARLLAEEEARNPAWYNTRTFGVIVGVVSTAAIFSISIYAVDQFRK